MHKSPLLTIAIPTWNRPDAVYQRLSELSLNLPHGVEVVVYENGETEATRKAVAPFLNDNIHYIPSPTNQGMMYNFLRCIATRESEWLWILGDDDAVLPGGISKLMNWLDVQEDTKFITSRPIYKTKGEKLVVNSTNQLFSASTFADALLISSTVWRRTEIRNNVGLFVDSSYTICPQLVAMLHIVDSDHSNGIVYLDSLVDPKITDHRWSRLSFLKRIPAVLDFLECEESRKATVGAIWPAWIWTARDSIKELDSNSKKSEWKNSFWTGLRQFSPYFGVYKHPIWMIYFLLINSPFRRLAVPWKIANIFSSRLVASKLLPSPIKS